MADEASHRGVWRNGAVGAILAIAAVAAIAALGYATGWRLTRETAAASCVADAAIDADTRDGLERAALDFVKAASGSNPIAAYPMLAADTKNLITPDKFMAALRTSFEAVAPFSQLHVGHYYVVRGASGARGQRIICGSVDRPEDWVAVTAKPIAEQAHLVVDADATRGKWVFTLWLVPENGWRVEGFNFAATEIGGRSLPSLLALARDQHAKHYDFNALLLYGAADRLATRGNDFQLGVEAALQGEIGKLPVPTFLRGKPPLTWKIGDDTYKIVNIGAAGVGDKLYVTITQELSPWQSDNDADTRNRLLIKDFTQAVPEYAAAFSGLILLARDDSGSHVYRTVATIKPPPQTGSKPEPAGPSARPARPAN